MRPRGPSAQSLLLTAEHGNIVSVLPRTISHGMNWDEQPSVSVIIKASRYFVVLRHPSRISIVGGAFFTASQHFEDVFLKHKTSYSAHWNTIFTHLRFYYFYSWRLTNVLSLFQSENSEAVDGYVVSLTTSGFNIKR